MKFWEALRAAFEDGAWIAPEPHRHHWLGGNSREAYKWDAARDRWRRMSQAAPGAAWVVIGGCATMGIGQWALSWDWEIVEVET